MNENIASYINTLALPEANAVYLRRICRKTLTEDRQRMKIIQELVELYDAYDLIGCEQMTETVLQRMKEGQGDQVIELYNQMLKNTRRAELADVVIATLTLKAILGETEWRPCDQVRAQTFISMIEKVAQGVRPDQILAWAVSFANTHDISLAEQIKIKLFYNGIRKDWDR